MSLQRYKIALVPLDDRPVSTRYPAMLADIGGAELHLPSPDIRGRQKAPPNLQEVVQWLLRVSVDADACIVSCDFLGYGNLINARISNENAATVLGRLALLTEINTRVPVHAFSLITRVSNANSCTEEPLYWADWGTRFYQFGRLWHRCEIGTADGGEQGELKQLESVIPNELRTDWLTRRLRNHVVNLALLDMAARNQIASLLLTSDDTAAYGLPTRERDWLRSWSELIGDGLNPGRVHMHPGADEVSSVIVARQINGFRGIAPRVWVDYAIAGDEEIVAPYEDRPVRQTVLAQIEASGCLAADSDQEADFVLAVVTPSPRRADFHLDFLESDRAARTAPYEAFIKRLDRYARQGKPLAIADVAYCNGADGLFSELLFAPDSPLDLSELAAYGAWNTAGNTIGVVVAQAALSIARDADPEARQKFLTHKILEDYGYQLRVRTEAWAYGLDRWGRSEPDESSPDEQAEICAFIEDRLKSVLSELHDRGIGEAWDIAPGSIYLPWRRTFEVDFELESSVDASERTLLSAASQQSRESYVH